MPIKFESADQDIIEIYDKFMRALRHGFTNDQLDRLSKYIDDDYNAHEEIIANLQIQIEDLQKDLYNLRRRMEKINDLSKTQED